MPLLPMMMMLMVMVMMMMMMMMMMIFLPARIAAGHGDARMRWLDNAGGARALPPLSRSNSSNYHVITI